MVSNEIWGKKTQKTRASSSRTFKIAQYRGISAIWGFGKTHEYVFSQYTIYNIREKVVKC